MEGQWLGRYAGTNAGTIFVDLDDVGERVEGHAFLFDDAELPGRMVPLKMPRGTKHEMKVHVIPLRPGHGAIISRDELAKLAPDVIFPTDAIVKIERTATLLKVSWTTNIDTSGSASIKQSQADRPSAYRPRRDVKNWKSFK
jgi:hypothetical protein